VFFIEIEEKEKEARTKKKASVDLDDDYDSDELEIEEKKNAQKIVESSGLVNESFVNDENTLDYTDRRRQTTNANDRSKLYKDVSTYSADRRNSGKANETKSKAAWTFVTTEV
jgi:hypothetical protein